MGSEADRGRRRGAWNERLRVVAVLGLVVVALMQAIPYGWEHPNPPVEEAAPWPSARAEAIAERACADCHSNVTQWPWYSYVAPMSWLVRRDVEEGRDELNFSTWDDDQGEADDAVEAVLDGSMPPDRYLLMHPEARLSDGEAEALVDALRQMQDKR